MLFTFGRRKSFASHLTSAYKTEGEWCLNSTHNEACPVLVSNRNCHLLDSTPHSLFPFFTPFLPIVSNSTLNLHFKQSFEMPCTLFPDDFYHFTISPFLFSFLFLSFYISLLIFSIMNVTDKSSLKRKSLTFTFLCGVNIFICIFLSVFVYIHFYLYFILRQQFLKGTNFPRLGFYYFFKIVTSPSEYFSDFIIFK